MLPFSFLSHYLASALDPPSLLPKSTGFFFLSPLKPDEVHYNPGSENAVPGVIPRRSASQSFINTSKSHGSQYYLFLFKNTLISGRIKFPASGHYFG